MVKKTGPQIRYVDVPEVSETFADSLHSASFDGHTLRIELCTTRLDEPKPPKPPTASQYPVCRLVLTPAAAADLTNRLQHIMTLLEKQGVMTRKPPTPHTIQ